ncbi:MAG: tRNA (adenosine(37)-N6)-threonylcarbamoyltransferase complex dimerization subunit type 1 TsaB [Pseudomonadota bacterium]
MIVLSLDTALKACSLAILRDGETVFDEFNLLEKGHAEVLPPLAARAFDSAGVRPDAVDRVAVTIGPGGFTGVRVGLAFARGFVLGNSARVVGVDTLTALRLRVKTSVDAASMTAVVIDARRGEVFAALFDAEGGVCLAPFAATPDAAATRLVDAAHGRTVALVDPDALLTAPDDWRRVEARPGVDPIALGRYAETVDPSDHPPTPLYLRAPDAKRAESASRLFGGGS